VPPFVCNLYNLCFTQRSWCNQCFAQTPLIANILGYFAEFLKDHYVNHLVPTGDRPLVLVLVQYVFICFFSLAGGVQLQRRENKISKPQKEKKTLKFFPGCRFLSTVIFSFPVFPADFSALTTWSFLLFEETSTKWRTQRQKKKPMTLGNPSIRPYRATLRGFLLSMKNLRL